MEYHVVGLAHSVGSYACEVVNTAVHAVIHNTFRGADTFAFHRQKRRKEGGRDSGSDLERARRFGAIADHARKVGNHVLDGKADMFVVSAHEVRDSTTTANTCHDTSAERGERTERLFDIDSREVAEHQRTDQFLLGILVLFGIDADGVGSADTLVSAATI